MQLLLLLPLLLQKFGQNKRAGYHPRQQIIDKT
jgi:hypothetical protein